ncbi:hypothetical protein M2132_000866 [Dysgonomonas sp. PH5-45]|uniref:hypothetical protein n=1 Tax=unclassified Dysgonomonas TaxID=2630389 RepID=UPI002474F880|nr:MULTISPECIES: hypothetical protein [unclassified Dysgonomonas]MDH6354538.1 hypothetical protein [Dysgonomonas sp. PH5-45]MDH6387406.1 hypothetical protein [Dysgonomonas sp. PH5-37]
MMKQNSDLQSSNNISSCYGCSSFNGFPACKADAVPPCGHTLEKEMLHHRSTRYGISPPLWGGRVG